MNEGFMFDTTVFNAIVRGQVDILSFEDISPYVTHIQFDELSETPDTERRMKLLEIFKELKSKEIPTESAVWDVSRWDKCKWGAEDSIYEVIKTELDRRKKKENNSQDSLIAETAILKHLTLVTDDKTLGEIVRGLNGKSVSLSQFSASMESGHHE